MIFRSTHSFLIGMLNREVDVFCDLNDVIENEKGLCHIS